MEGFGNLLLQICFLKKSLHKKEDNLALKDKQSVPKGRRPLQTLNTNFSDLVRGGAPSSRMDIILSLFLLLGLGSLCLDLLPGLLSSLVVGWVLTVEGLGEGGGPSLRMDVIIFFFVLLTEVGSL